MVLFCGICVVGFPLPVLVITFARRWREARRDAEEKKLGFDHGGDLDEIRRRTLVFTTGRIERPLAKLPKDPDRAREINRTAEKGR